MKRFLVLCGAFLLSGLLVGCGTDTRVGLVKDTINMIEEAAGKIGIIKTRVDDAVKLAESSSKKLDLSAAIEATKALKETGDNAQIIRRKIEKVRSEITDDERKTYAKEQKVRLNAAFTDLLKQKTELRASLAAAAKLPGAKSTVDDLRAKIVEAEAPFEALGR